MIITALLFGIAANSDNVSVGISYGIKHRRISWWHNGVIAVVTTCITLCALATGRTLRHYLFPDLPSWISGVLLMLLAVWSGYRHPRPEDEAFMVNQTGATLAETLYLSLALSVNNIGLALAGGIGDLGYGAAAASVFTFSVIMLAAGQLIGGHVVEMIRVLRHPMVGNAVLFLAGVMMLAGCDCFTMTKASTGAFLGLWLARISSELAQSPERRGHRLRHPTIANCWRGMSKLQDRDARAAGAHLIGFSAQYCRGCRRLTQYVALPPSAFRRQRDKAALSAVRPLGCGSSLDVTSPCERKVSVGTRFGTVAIARLTASVNERRRC